MGKRETGSSVAAPIFKEFMKGALKDIDPTPFRVPSGVKHVRVSADTGKSAMPGDNDIIWEAFVTGTEPNSENYAQNNQIIGYEYTPDTGLEDDNGYDQFGYEDYSDNYSSTDVETTGNLEENEQTENDNPFSYFQNKKRDNGFNNERITPRSAPPAERQRPSLGNNEDGFSGTGGIY